MEVEASTTTKGPEKDPDLAARIASTAAALAAIRNKPCEADTLAFLEERMVTLKAAQMAERPLAARLQSAEDRVAARRTTVASTQTAVVATQKAHEQALRDNAEAQKGLDEACVAYKSLQEEILVQQGPQAAGAFPAQANPSLADLVPAIQGALASSSAWGGPAMAAFEAALLGLLALPVAPPGGGAAAPATPLLPPPPSEEKGAPPREPRDRERTPPPRASRASSGTREEASVSPTPEVVSGSGCGSVLVVS